MLADDKVLPNGRATDHGRVAMQAEAARPQRAGVENQSRMRAPDATENGQHELDQRGCTVAEPVVDERSECPGLRHVGGGEGHGAHGRVGQ